MQDPLDETLMDLMTIQSLKAQNGGATSGQTLEADLFELFLMTLDEFGHEIGTIGNFISLPFQSDRFSAYCSGL